MKEKIIAIIPARGGSKGIPRKNIKELKGKPLLAYTIEAAKESGVFDRIITSTDDEEIAQVGKSLGAEVPFIRPHQLASDTAPTQPVIEHCLKWLKEKEAYEPDIIFILQPTAPLRKAFHIKEALDLFKEKGADSLVSVVEVPRHYTPYWAVIRGEDGFARLFSGEPIKKRITRRQDFPQKVYAHNSAIYILKPEILLSHDPSLYGEKTVLYEMKPEFSVNIDSMEDWHDAERLLESNS